MSKTFAISSIIAITLILAFGLIIYMANNQGKILGTQAERENTSSDETTKFTRARIGERELKLRVADTEELRMKGLSGTTELAENQGMLFIFEKPDIYPFWMKDMNYAIDIIWLKDKRIVEIWADAKPPSESGKIESRTPQVESDMTLEVNAGFAEQYNLKIGDELIIH